MKRITILLLLLSPLFIIAQSTTEGEVYYSEKIKLNIELPEGQEHLKEMLPESQTVNKQLLFTSEKLAYRDMVSTEEEEDDAEAIAEEGNVRIKVVASSPDDLLYQDLKTGEITERKSFMGKRFLINGQAKERNWKLTGQQKEVLGYACQQATYQDDNINLIAWFAPSIPLPIGPEDYGKLPGLILEVNIDEGSRVITATKVEFRDVNEDDIQAPTKGKKVSQEKFEKIVEEKMKENNGNTVIKMRMN